MGKMTPAQAKNAIRRALNGVVDPSPSDSQVHQVWAFFESSCAYCGKELVRGNRDGHLDHLVSSGSGGSNALANRVLSCGNCNGDEKRDEHWQTFLRKKATDSAAFAQRKTRIEMWVASREATPGIDDTLRQDVAAEVGTVLKAFDNALSRIRKLRDGA